MSNNWVEAFLASQYTADSMLFTLMADKFLCGCHVLSFFLVVVVILQYSSIHTSLSLVSLVPFFFFPCLDSCLESFKLFLKEPPRSCTTTEEDRLSPCASRLIRQPKLFRNDAHSSSDRVRPSWRDPITINPKCDVLFFLEMSTFEFFLLVKKEKKKQRLLHVMTTHLSYKCVRIPFPGGGWQKR